MNFFELTKIIIELVVFHLLNYMKFSGILAASFLVFTVGLRHQVGFFLFRQLRISIKVRWFFKQNVTMAGVSVETSLLPGEHFGVLLRLIRHR